MGIQNRGDDIYKALSWAGLMGTTAWDQFSKDINTKDLAQQYLRTIQFFYDNKEIWEDHTCGTLLAQ